VVNESSGWWDGGTTFVYVVKRDSVLRRVNVGTVATT